MSNTPNSHQHQHEKNIALLFHQVNVGKGGPNMDIALQQAWDGGAHVVMIQEPWTMKKGEGFITKSHPGYNSHKPIGRNGTRPRAITFTRKGLHATQIFFSTSQTADYCFVKVSGVMFVNVYRAPRPSGALEPLLQWATIGSTIFGGTLTQFQGIGNHRHLVSMATVIRSWSGLWLRTCF